MSSLSFGAWVAIGLGVVVLGIIYLGISLSRGFTQKAPESGSPIRGNKYLRRRLARQRGREIYREGCNVLIEQRSKDVLYNLRDEEENVV
jgi:hypothetical protein